MCLHNRDMNDYRSTSRRGGFRGGWLCKTSISGSNPDSAPILAGAACGLVRIAALTSALNRWRSESGFAGTLCVISTMTVCSFGSIQKIVPAVPSHPYSPMLGERALRITRPEFALKRTPNTRYRNVREEVADLIGI